MVKSEDVEAQVKEKFNKHFNSLVYAFLIAILVIWLISQTFMIVPAGYRGILLTFGAVQSGALEEGLHIIIPVRDSVQLMQVRTLKYEVAAECATKDLLDVNTKIAVNYHIGTQNVTLIYQTLGQGYEDTLIAPAVQEIVKQTTAEFNAEELIVKRPIIKQEIEYKLIQRLQDRGVYVEVISLTDFSFPAQFNEAITAKQTSVQLRQKAENDLEIIKVEANQAIAKAQGAANSTIIQAQGNAETIRIINEQLKQSTEYTQFLAIQKWNGVLPLATGGTLPFIQIPINQSG